MALGWNDLERMKRVEAQANKLGFKLTNGNPSWIISNEPSTISVKPLGDMIPLYNRDATFFSGSIESIASWLDGIEWARDYDELLKVSNDKKRQKQEQLVRHRHLMKTIETGTLVQGQLGASDDEELTDDIPF